MNIIISILIGIYIYFICPFSFNFRIINNIMNIIKKKTFCTYIHTYLAYNNPQFPPIKETILYLSSNTVKCISLYSREVHPTRNVFNYTKIHTSYIPDLVCCRFACRFVFARSVVVPIWQLPSEVQDQS